METREEQHNHNKKENEKDMKKRKNKQYKWCNIFLIGSKMIEGNITYILMLDI